MARSANVQPRSQVLSLPLGGRERTLEARLGNAFFNKRSSATPACIQSSTRASRLSVKGRVALVAKLSENSVNVPEFGVIGLKE